MKSIPKVRWVRKGGRETARLKSDSKIKWVREGGREWMGEVESSMKRKVRFRGSEEKSKGGCFLFVLFVLILRG